MNNPELNEEHLEDANHYFILEGKEIKAVDVVAWGLWCKQHQSTRSLRRDSLGEVQISTVFLGINHSVGFPPAVFETMVFGGEYDEYIDRYCTYDDAVEGHKRVVEMVFGPLRAAVIEAKK